MTVAYRLSWEEYAEQFEHSWPRRNTFAVIASIIIALPLLFYGLGLSWFGLPGERTVSWLFIGAPFALILAAILSITVETSQRRKRATAEMQELYNRRQANEQKLFFDEEKWIHETDAGRQEAPWSALLLGIELKNVFLLTGGGHSVVVPKRALDADGIQQLRQAAVPFRGDGWNFRISSWDHQVVETALLWRKKWILMILGNIAALAVLVWIVENWIGSNEKLIDMWGWLLALVAVVMLLTAQLWYLPLSFATSAKPWRLPMKVELSECGVGFATSWASFFIAWKAFLKFKEFQRAFLIYTQQDHYYLLAKRCITSEQQDKLRRALLANVPQD